MFISDDVAALSAATDLDFFWEMMGSMSTARESFCMLEDAHEEEVDDACAMYMAGQEL